MIRKALMLKVVSWIILSPLYAVAQPPQQPVRGFVISTNFNQTLPGSNPSTKDISCLTSSSQSALS